METKLLSTDRPIALYYAFISDVVSFTQQGSSHCSVQLADDWKLIHTTIGSINLNETPSETRAGTLYENKLTAVAPGHDESSPAHIAAISGRRLILRLDYRNGMKKIIGDATTGPKLYIETISYSTTSRRLQSNYKSKSPNRWLV